MTLRRHLPTLATLLLAAPATALAQSPPAEAPSVTVAPERPVQGHLFVLRVADPGGSIASVTGEAAGETLHFERAADGAWESLAAVPIDASDALETRVVVRDAGGGTHVLQPRVSVAEGSYRHERLTVAPRLGSPLNAADQARLAEDQAKARAVSANAHRTPRLRGTEVVLPRRDRVTSGFGNGRVFNDQVSSRHMGLDLDGEPGDTVRAPMRGVVELVDDFLLAGRIVYLNHGGGLVSGYFHLSEQLVSQGDTVSAGTPIGLVGATGRVTGPHLHWVVRYGSISVDPRSLPGLTEVPPGG